MCAQHKKKQRRRRAVVWETLFAVATPQGLDLREKEGDCVVKHVDVGDIVSADMAKTTSSGMENTCGKRVMKIVWESQQKKVKVKGKGVERRRFASSVFANGKQQDNKSGVLLLRTLSDAECERWVAYARKVWLRVHDL